PLTTQRRYAPRHFPRDRSTHQAVFLLLRRPPPSTLFPYTTLFRSGTRRCSEQADARVGDVELGHIGAAKTVYFILAVVAWVGHGVDGCQSRNVYWRACHYQAVAAVLPDKHAVGRKRFVNIVRVGVTDFRLTIWTHSQL